MLSVQFSVLFAAYLNNFLQLSSYYPSSFLQCMVVLPIYTVLQLSSYYLTSFLQLFVAYLNNFLLFSSCYLSSFTQWFCYYPAIIYPAFCSCSIAILCNFCNSPAIIYIAFFCSSVNCLYNFSTLQLLSIKLSAVVLLPIYTIFATL
jgi:hypothetical protein